MTPTPVPGSRQRDDARVRVLGDPTKRVLSLADAAGAIAGASTVDELLEVVTEAARDIIGAHQAVATRLYGGTWEHAATYVSLSDKYAQWRSFDTVPKGLGVLNAVTRENQPLRLTGEQLQAHPEYRGLRDAPDHPPLPDYLAAPLISRNGDNIGLIQLSDKLDGAPFDEDDEAVCVQLALMVSSALEHLEVAAELEQTLSQLQLTLDASNTGTWEWRFATNQLTGSPVLDTVFGGSFPSRLDELLAVVHPDDVAVGGELRALRDITGPVRYRHRIVRPDGETRWLEGAALPLTDAAGQVVGVSGVCVDVTERELVADALRRERDVVAALHDVGRSVTARLDTNEVVQRVTDAATALTGAQFGAFFYNVVGEAGQSYALYTISGVPREKFSRFPMPRNTQIFAPTFQGEGVVRLPDVTRDPRYGQLAPHFGMPEGHLPVRSYLAVPVVLSTGEVAGGLFFGHEQAGVFDDDAEQLAVGIAGYAAIALENGRLYEAARRESRAKERVVAALERPLQPPPLPQIPGVAVGATYEPYGGAGELGGDFYECFELPGGRWFVALGDVSGKGPDAAALTGLVRHTLWAAAQSNDDVVDVLHIVNRALLRSHTDRFATVVAAVLTPRRHFLEVEAAWAGHPAGLLLDADAPPSLVHGDGMALGMFEQIEVECVRRALTPGQSLLLYTDGLVERANDVLDEADLTQLVHAAGQAATSPQHLVDAVVSRIDAGYRRRDDLAVLVLRSVGDGGEASTAVG